MRARRSADGRHFAFRNCDRRAMVTLGMHRGLGEELARVCDMNRDLLTGEAEAVQDDTATEQEEDMPCRRADAEDGRS